MLGGWPRGIPGFLPVAAACLASILAGCRTRPVDPLDSTGNPGDPGTDGPGISVDLGRLPPTPVDVLIVFSSEFGTSSLRDRIRAAAPALFASLANVADWHVGIVSADVGVGRTDVNNCGPTGDAGKLNPTSPLCNMQVPSFLAGSGAKPTNFSGDPAKVFSGCYVGEMPPGCEYQQPWNAAIQALSPSINPGFLRPDSTLAIIFAVDTEDCSVPDNSSRLFSPNAPFPEGTVRCFVNGAACSQPISAAGTYDGCLIPKDSGDLLGSDDILKRLRAAAGVSRRVHVGLLTGRSSTVTVDRNDNISAVCQENTQGDIATPAVRLDNFPFTPGSDFTVDIADSVCGDYAKVFSAVVAEAAQ